MRTIVLALMALFIFGCDQKPYQEPQPVVYTLHVNYIGNNIGNPPPSDTIIITSLIEPYIYVNNQIPCLMGDDWAYPIATYVRSFKILSKK